VVQGYAWFFYGYEATMHYLAGPGKTKADLSYKEVMLAGIMAGFGLWGSMFPIDTIKSKMQVGGWWASGCLGRVGKVGLSSDGW